ncbi:MAG: hypothetical protein KGL94_06895 [Acidobacteriota bacterium]|nr:hypothetical protein [Acidobacteriota bacterium]
MRLDPVLGTAAGLIFVAVGAAYEAGGQTIGRIAAVVLIVPFVAWVGLVVRRRRATGPSRRR